MRRLWHLKVFFLLPLLLVACGQPDSSLDEWYSENGKLKVLSTVAMIDDLVREVAGQEVDRLVLISGSLDPHSYELVKGDDEKLGGADLIFCSGLGLEHGPSLQRFLEDSDRVVAIGNAIVEEDPGALVRIDGEVDPHIWMDVKLWSRAVGVIVAELSQRLPEHRLVFQQRGGQLTRRLIDLDTEVMAQMARISPSRRYLVTTHDAFNYFTRRYLATPHELERHSWKDRCMGPEGLSPECQLSVADISAVIDQLQAYDIHVIFPESNLSRDSIQKITGAGREKGLTVRIAQEPLYGDAMGEPGSGGDTYEGMMRHNARVIASNLLGEVTDD